MLNPPETALDIFRLGIALASLAFALGYFLLLDAPSSALRSAVKTLPFGLLAFLPLSLIGSFADTRGLVVLSAALALSALGDLLLSLKDQSRFFVLGLASFLAAHIAYVFVFLPYAALPAAASLGATLVVIVAALLLLVRLWPRLGKLRLPVAAYAAVILCMVAAAIAIPNAPWWFGVGAALFAFSDALIAVRKFMQPFAGISPAIWATYCAAQYLIVLGLLFVPILV